ncbi:hypothetical protein B0H19DRAFT_1071420 [Mycena capillaripes]|nr:hypothetical protein B0H19DRAFT_1071420 [Mycena capillaripes]
MRARLPRSDCVQDVIRHHLEAGVAGVCYVMGFAAAIFVVETVVESPTVRRLIDKTLFTTACGGDGLGKEATHRGEGKRGCSNQNLAKAASAASWVAIVEVVTE